MSKIKDKIILGTADFGNKISFMESERILAAFFQQYNSIQTATNYPMSNQIPFGSTLNFLKKYLDDNGIVCNLTVNIGSLSNNITDNNDVTPTFFYANFLLLKEMFPKQNLTLALHWDNQNESRDDLVDLFCELQSEVKIGLSGIDFPANYSSHKIEYDYQVNSYIDKQRNFLLSTHLRKHLMISNVIGYQILGGKKLLFDRMEKLLDFYGEKDEKNFLSVVLKDNLLRYDKVIIAPKSIQQTLMWLKTADALNDI